MAAKRPWLWFVAGALVLASAGISKQFGLSPPLGGSCRSQDPGYANHGPRDRRRVALTFDDGPAASTPYILRTLRDHRAKATFFVTGRRARGRPHLLLRMRRDGHEVGNHTFGHRALVGNVATVRSEIERASAVIREITGDRPRLFRAPYGVVTPAVTKEARAAGMLTVGWDVDSRDWVSQRIDLRMLYRRIVRRLRPGSIVLLHDGGDSRRHAARVLPRLLSIVAARGYRAVTVSQLLEPSCRTVPE